MDDNSKYSCEQNLEAGRDFPAKLQRVTVALPSTECLGRVAFSR